jgi:hypothetical protein
MTRALFAPLALAVAVVAVVAGAAHAAAETYRIEAVAEPGADDIWGPAKVVVRDADGAVVARRHAVPAKVALDPAGDYEVTVIYKSAAGKSALAGSVTTVNLAAGELSLALVEREGGPKIEGAHPWRVHYYRPGEATGKLVAEVEGSNPVLTLSEGWYEVETSRDGRDVAHTVRVTAGTRYDYTIVAESQ